MSASGKKVRAFSQSATQKARLQVSLLSIGSICRGFARQIVPTLRVGMHPVTLCVTTLRADAERPWRHSHAERGNDQWRG
ncbi:hypothetical protein CUN61_02800 [Pseudomonas arsenicoxydans]|uniref:Uncharacterized protein n=1 Tax=Pseudomonas arsenicoxydans TaxID=702115 RepID=A0A4P6FWY7_9PSED|nr:hypothetical protein CUN61_02800 [Pseudomonas arsenicoxydans]